MAEASREKPIRKKRPAQKGFLVVFEKGFLGGVVFVVEVFLT